MGAFIVLIGELLFIAFLQTIIEAALNEEKRSSQIKVVNIACVAVSYGLLVRFVYLHLLEDIMGFVRVITY